MGGQKYLYVYNDRKDVSIVRSKMIYCGAMTWIFQGALKKLFQWLDSIYSIENITYFFFFYLQDL